MVNTELAPCPSNKPGLVLVVFKTKVPGLDKFNVVEDALL